MASRQWQQRYNHLPAERNSKWLKRAGEVAFQGVSFSACEKTSCINRMKKLSPLCHISLALQNLFDSIDIIR